METASSNVRPVPKSHPIPRHRKTRSNYFLEYSLKEQSYVEFESSLEYFVWLFMEFNPAITRLAPQTPRIEKLIKGKQFIYTFDLWVRHKDYSEQCIEVKPESKLVPDRAGIPRPKNWDLIKDLSEELDLDIAYITDQLVESKKQYLENLSQIYPFVKESHLDNDEPLRKRVVHFAGQSAGIALIKLKSCFPEESEQRVYQAAFHAIYLGEVSADLGTKPVDTDLVIEVRNVES